MTATSPDALPCAMQRMAKIIVTLFPGKEVDKEELQQAAVYIFGYSQGFLNNRTNLLQGWGNKWILTDKNELGTHSLFIIPQDMTGRDFIRIATPRRLLCFTPFPRQARLQEGHTYHYSIKVHPKNIEIMWAITTSYHP